ncbi:uncharacterized protein DNG_09631 [Cephalotrichum gorgonifer]|uniref:Uncharacterized protein n=1 Tax=Cephalotrichum gorgonifer TaxID=2041049 RepID=A0AAE8N677_9PEZI|nr:uncharacterized protein DNG_09631 [Cephalotrichum gorgonifer]
MGGERKEIYKWCAVDTITINIEAQDMPNVPYDDGWRNVFGHSTFRGSDGWPEFEAPPAGVSNPRYTSAYKIARDMRASFQLMAGHNFHYALFGELLCANVDKIEILVNGVIYERIYGDGILRD